MARLVVVRLFVSKAWKQVLVHRTTPASSDSVLVQRSDQAIVGDVQARDGLVDLLQYLIFRGPSAFLRPKRGHSLGGDSLLSRRRSLITTAFPHVGVSPCSRAGRVDDNARLAETLIKGGKGRREPLPGASAALPKWRFSVHRLRKMVKSHP